MKAYLGDFVRTGKHGHRGRVIIKHHNAFLSNTDEDWFKAQSISITEEEMKEPWYSILCQGAGSVMVNESDIVEIMKSYKFENSYADFYFKPE